MATYKEIQCHVKGTYGFVPKTCWIADMKEECKLLVKQSHNRISADARKNPCPPSKKEPIRSAFMFFKMI